jgi:hypothetical protein
MKWTKDLPSQWGIYWLKKDADDSAACANLSNWKNDPNMKPDLIEWHGSDEADQPEKFQGWWWYGPLVAPPLET